MRIGSLFSGYGGLCELAVAPTLGGTVAWHSEIDKDASHILAHHWPDTPNHGDLTKVDWSQVEPVDVLTGGFPCQDLSHAGKRLGLRPGTRSGLWSHMAYAVSQLRPRMVVIENVRGLLSAGAHSDLEPCPWCLGDGEDGALRALGAVLGDLAELGYDARWRGVLASDAGAPHGRFRVFVVAYPQGDPGWVQHRDGDAAADAGGIRRAEGRSPAPGQAPGGRPLGESPGRRLLPTPRATDGSKGGPNQRGSSGDLMLPSAVAHLLPTPAVNDMGEGKTPDAWDAWTASMQERHSNGNGHGKSLAIEAQRLLPTPTAQAAKHTSDDRGPGTLDDHNLWSVATRADQWGIYADAIARWEALTRPAPPPSQPSSKGTAQLSPAFSEWMLGLPAGHVTDPAIWDGIRPSTARNAQLKALGNGVVPQQAALALRWLLTGGFVAQGGLRVLPTPTVGDSKSARNSTATRHRIPPTGIHAGDTLTDILVPRMEDGAA